MRPRTLLDAGAAAALGAALWWRKNPSACPYGQRFWVEAPHPIVTRERLFYVMRPEAGERVLEIGPGTGYYTLDIAEWVGPEGRVEIFDLQQEFLDHTMRRAAERGLENVVPTQGDATDLPYEEGSMDAVVLNAVLGEIPDPVAALREIRRVLKPDGPPAGRRALRRPPLHHPGGAAAPGRQRPASPTRSSPATGSATSRRLD